MMLSLLVLVVVIAVLAGVGIGTLYAVRRIGDRQSDADRSARLANLEARVLDLEERLDFTERVLGESRGHPPLGRGS